MDLANYLLSGLAVAALAGTICGQLRFRRPPKGLCSHCEYPIPGNTDRCPECGTRVDLRLRWQWWRPKWHLTTASLSVLGVCLAILAWQRSTDPRHISRWTCSQLLTLLHISRIVDARGESTIMHTLLSHGRYVHADYMKVSAVALDFLKHSKRKSEEEWAMQFIVGGSLMEDNSIRIEHPSFWTFAQYPSTGRPAAICPTPVVTSLDDDKRRDLCSQVIGHASILPHPVVLAWLARIPNRTTDMNRWMAERIAADPDRVNSLCRMIIDPLPVVQELTKLIKEDGSLAGRRLTDIIDLLGVYDYDTVDVLLNIATGDAPREALTAFFLLLRWAGSDMVVAGYVCEAAGNPGTERSIMACRVLGARARKSPECYRDLLMHSDPKVKAWAAESLYRVTGLHQPLGR